MGAVRGFRPTSLFCPTNSGVASKLPGLARKEPAVLAGLYPGLKCIARLETRSTRLVAAVPPAREDRVTLELRCQGWVPKNVVPGSKDNRALGVSVYTQ